MKPKTQELVTLTCSRCEHSTTVRADKPDAPERYTDKGIPISALGWMSFVGSAGRHWVCPDCATQGMVELVETLLGRGA